MISVGKKIIKLGPSAALYENGSYQGKTFNKIVIMKLSYIPVHEAPKAFFKLPKPSIVDQPMVARLLKVMTSGL